VSTTAARADAFAAFGTIVGHRGGRGDGWPPENTMPAFERAVTEGARAIELDVRTCASGEIVVFHDDTLARMAGDARRVADVRAAELSAIELDGARIPFLADVLAWASDQNIAVNVELKHDVPDRTALARAVARVVSASRANVVLSSFDPRLMATMAALSPRVPRAQLTGPRQPRAGVLHAVARPPFVQALHVERTQTSPSWIDRWKKRGLRVGVWTVNDPREARDLLALGVDYVITDRPGEMLAG